MNGVKHRATILPQCQTLRRHLHGEQSEQCPGAKQLEALHCPWPRLAQSLFTAQTPTHPPASNLHVIPVT